jgi:hypothetical protein
MFTILEFKIYTFPIVNILCSLETIGKPTRLNNFIQIMFYAVFTLGMQSYVYGFTHHPAKVIHLLLAY